MAEEWSIVQKGKNYHVTTNAGEFQMPAKVFDLFYNKSHPDNIGLDRELASVLSRLVDPKPYHEKRSYEEELDNAVKTLLADRGLKSLDYLDKYKYGPSEKMQELIPHVTDKIKHLMAREYLFFLFSNRSEADQYTFAEHRAMGSSSGAFLGNPFMGGFSAAPNWAEETRARRAAWVKRHTHLAISLLKKPSKVYVRTKGPVGADTWHFEPPEAHNELVAQMQALYTKHRPSAVEAPEHVRDLDLVRVLFSAVQFNKKMHAFPKPARLEFCHGGKVVAVSTDRKVLRALRIKPRDVKIAEEITDQTGRVYHIGATSKGTVHKLRIIKPAKPWVDNYLERVQHELAK